MNYVLVSQGIKIYETPFKEEAELMCRKSNEDYEKYRQECMDHNEPYADNEVEIVVEK